MDKISLSMYIDNNLLHNKERNLVDYKPLVSTITGIIKVCMGIFIILAGIVLLPFDLFQKGNGQEGPLILNQGILMVIRGAISIVPILGNWTLHTYDYYVANNSISAARLEALLEDVGETLLNADPE